MNNPVARIFLGYLGLLVGSSVVLGLIDEQNPFHIAFMLILGAVIGPFLGLSYPFEINVKAVYIASLVAALATIFCGALFSKRIWGQILAVAGLAGWTALGVLGLGTAT